MMVPLSRRDLAVLILALLLGFFGRAAKSFWDDLAFLHQARLYNEAASRQPSAGTIQQQQVTPAPTPPASPEKK